MYLYFLLIRIAAFFGHRKARQMILGQQSVRIEEGQLRVNGKAVPQHALWIHAASVGEFEQARPLIERLKANYEKQKIVVTFFSPSGYEMRKNYELADAVLYLPFATRRNARQFIDALQPKTAVFVKYEFWPAYLRELKKRSIPTYCISAIFRAQQAFFRWWGVAYRNVLQCFTRIYVQDEASRALLEKYGIPQAVVSGDTRFDRVKEIKERCATDSRLAERLAPVEEFVRGCDRVIVAGSTWPEDEELLAKYMKAQIVQGQSTKLILVPHELDENHLHFIFNLFKGRFVRYSDICGHPSAFRQNIIQHANILVIDTMGLLSSLYRFCQAGYIGGGFGAGIHNTLEAAVYGVPVLFGPNYRHFREANGLIDAGAARSIKNYKELEAALDTALEQRREIGAKAAEYVESELGATEKIYKQIF